MNVSDILKALPASLILGVMGIGALFVLLIPLALKLAGLTGQQIVDTLTLTLNTFLALVKEFRQQNKSGGTG